MTDVATASGTTTVRTSGVVRLSFVNRGMTYYWLQLADVRVTTDAAGVGAVTADVSAWVAAQGGGTETVMAPVRLEVATLTASGVARGASVTSSAQAFTGAFVAALPSSMRAHFNGLTEAKLAAPVTVALEDGCFVWSKGIGTYAAGKGTVAFPGSLRFTGHHDELDLTFTDVRLVVVSATKAEIRIDADIKAYLGNPAQVLDDVVIGTVDLRGAVTTSGKATRIVNAPVTLAASGVPAFAGFYEAGDALVPVSATLTVTKVCDEPGTDGPGTGEPGTGEPTEAPAPSVSLGGDVEGTDVALGGTVSFTTTGLPSRASTSAEVHSDPVSLGSRRASATGSVTYTFKVPADFPKGKHTFVLTAAGVEGTVTRTFRVVGASEPTTTPSDESTAEPSDTATTSDAPTCTARVVDGATLSWAIKDSFVSYIEGSIAQGSIATSGARRSGSTFTWSGGAGTFNTTDVRGTARFSGSVTTTGAEAAGLGGAAAAFVVLGLGLVMLQRRRARLEA